jgi:gliding motility-associated-like protein
VFVTDANGCVSSSTVDILIFPEIKIPNGFSPNADGRNDSWIIDNIQQFPESRVEVYNRWGELLFASPPGYPTPFDGKYKGKDLPVGTYYYIINLNHVAYPDAYTGPLTIFR